MERRLILMRHAQSAAAGAASSDHERPLTKRGHAEASEIADRLVSLGWTPQVVMGSDATRTRESWEVMESSFQPTPEVIWKEWLYLTGVAAIERALGSLDDEITDVLLLGHNPGWQNAISYFAGCQERMTTANAALLHGQGDSWEETAVNGGFELVQILRPRSI